MNGIVQNIDVRQRNVSALFIVHERDKHSLLVRRRLVVMLISLKGILMKLLLQT